MVLCINDPCFIFIKRQDKKEVSHSTYLMLTEMEFKNTIKRPL